MEILLALGAAVSYGASDFVGGFLGKTVRVVVVVLLAQLVSVVVLIAVLPFWDGELSAGAIGWGAAAGLAGGGGASLLYRGLAIGRMSVVAPITALLAAGIPVVFGLAVGERPGPVALSGVGVGLLAVAIITRAPNSPGPQAPGDHAAAQAPPVSTGGIGEAVGAGFGFGLFFILLDRSPDDSGLWPLMGMRISMIVAFGLILAIGRISLRTPPGTTRGLLGLGFLNVLADLLYLLATRRGLLALVAVITSMYPAATVLMARLVLRERVAGRQLLGLAVAAASVVLIAWR